MNDTHNSLVVHYPGKDCIVVVAKDDFGKRASSKKGDDNSSSSNKTSFIFLSEDYGSSFLNITDRVMGSDNNKELPSIDNFVKHPSVPGTVSQLDF